MSSLPRRSRRARTPITLGRGRGLGLGLGLLLVLSLALASAVAPTHPLAQARHAGRRGRTYHRARAAHVVERAVFSSLPAVLTRPARAGASYRLHRWSVPLAGVELDLTYVPRFASVDRALRAAHGLLVVNAGFFHRDGAPVGLTVAHGRQITPFDPRLVGGVLTVAGGRAELHATETFARAQGIDFALQSKPRLVVDRAINTADDRFHADRTAVCLRDGGRAMDLYVARSDHRAGRGGPTLRALARTLAALGCHQALNLDGGPSTSAAWRDGARVRVLAPRDPIRQVIVVRARSATAQPGATGTPSSDELSLEDGPSRP